MVSSIARFVSASSRSPLRIAITSLSGTIIFGLFDYNVSRSIVETGLSSESKAAMQAAIVGIGAGLALWALLVGVADRRKQIAAELNRLAELNHTIRNSLEIIVLAHHGEVNQQHRELVLDCTRRIDLKLKELFPGCNSPLKQKP